MWLRISGTLAVLGRHTTLFVMLEEFSIIYIFQMR